MAVVQALPPVKTFAEGLLKLADREAVTLGSREVAGEILYLLCWYVWERARQVDPAWTQTLLHKVAMLRPGLVRDDAMRARFTDYAMSAAASDDPQPHWSTALTFRKYACNRLSATDMKSLAMKINGLLYNLDERLRLASRNSS